MHVPLFKKKTGSLAVINPSDALTSAPRQRFLLPEGVILAYDRRIVERAVRARGVKRFDGFHGSYYSVPTTRGSFCLTKIPSGASVSALVLEELIARGAKRFISIGWAGTLQDDFHAGDIVVCTRAIRDEGTSCHYLKAAKFITPSPSLTRQLKSSLLKAGMEFRTGSSWTTDAFYRETVDEVKRYQREGVLTVEMEASALFAVGAYRKVDVAAAFVICDSLVTRPWKEATSKRIPGSMRALFEAAKGALRG